MHDTRWLAQSCPRLITVLRHYGHAISVYRTGAEARNAMDPLVIADDRHFLHRFHVDGPRAALAFDSPIAARPLVARFEEIWATGEPGLSVRCWDSEHRGRIRIRPRYFPPGQSPGVPMRRPTSR
ncbi:MAG: hypothetical protein IPF73_19125 [Betaproteobacteria bacterium]|nr:hypothetical protein [Betaproteobacteria bacterium]